MSLLACDGSATSPAAQRLQLLTLSIAACKANIQHACVSSLLAFEAASTATCVADMDAFNVAVSACTSATTSACTCWKDVNLETLSNKIASCSLSTFYRLH